MNILITYLHYIGIMCLMGALIAEHLMLKPGMSKQQIKSLATIDAIYGISIIIVLATGLLRWLVVDPKGAAFFNTNPLFHIKVTLFVILAILSIFPMLKFMKWRKQVNAGEAVDISTKDAKKQLMLIRIELLLMAIIPLLAVMVSGGVRM